MENLNRFIPQNHKVVKPELKPELDVATSGSAGLSRVTNLHAASLRRREAVVRIWTEATLVQVKIPQSPSPSRRGFRKSITTFTSKARANMLRVFARIDRRHTRPLSLTLTYPQEYPATRVTKEHLRAFAARLERAFPRCGFIWKLEYQARGAPHYHLLLFGVPPLDREQLSKFRRWISRIWYHVVKSGDEKHARAGTRVEYVKTRRKIQFYAAKWYQSKPVTVGSGDSPGRFWGVVNREAVFSPCVIVRLTVRAAYRLLRYLRNYVHAARRAWKPGRPAWLRRIRTFFVNEPAVWLARLDDLLDDLLVTTPT